MITQKQTEYWKTKHIELKGRDISKQGKKKCLEDIILKLEMYTASKVMHTWILNQSTEPNFSVLPLLLRLLFESRTFI